ncbi:MAG: PocR ligand-binding domain-containing protein [Eubacteriales bacterium]|nr:PocR ligand-binding domain-containing protein [Eubacteriales bacterium]
METSIDLDLAAANARSFFQAAGVGCLLALPDGKPITQAGYVCARSSLCKKTVSDHADCHQHHRHALSEAERFGGKYVYYCPHGLGFAVSPIMGRGGCEAKLQAGPFLMADAEDYLSVELSGLLAESPDNEENLRTLLAELPCVPPARVSALSNMLFLAASFVSSAQEVSHLRLKEANGLQQGQISAYILQIKQEEKVAPYPYDKEQALLEAMAQNRRKDAGRLLNELLGVILIISGMSFSRMKSHINELLVLLSRKAVENGADPALIQRSTHQYYQDLTRIQAFEELCFWLSEVVNQLMTLAFDFGDTRHAGAIRRAIGFIRHNLAEKITLEQIAAEAFMSPAYFSRVFKQEVGRTVQRFILDERLKRAESLMRARELSLLQAAELSGLGNLSFFNRVIRRQYGVSPGELRRILWQEIPSGRE